jgi:phosphate transport system substrate-binding protein
MAPLVQEIARRFEAAHPGVRLDVQAVGSARGVSDTQQGLADIGMVARPLRPEESALHAALLARDGVCLVVPRANPVTALDDTQVVGLFARTVDNWKRVGGPDAPVTVVAFPDARALAQVFLDHYHLRPGQVRPDLVAGDPEQVLQAVAGKPSAIGCATVGAAAAAADTLALRLLPCGKVPATPANVANGTYALIRPLLLVTREPPQGVVGEFIDFARSPAVRDVLDKYHEAPPAD